MSLSRILNQGGACVCVTQEVHLGVNRDREQGVRCHHPDRHDFMWWEISALGQK
jgi:hypothetical protein